MSYQLTTYSPSYLEKQYEIGHHQLSQWLGARQSPIERLKQVYSGPDFEPKTKFYALHKGEVIGFIPSKIRKKSDDSIVADMEFPILADEHGEAESQLIIFAFEQLKAMGVSTIYSRVSDAWGTTMEMANKYGFEKHELKWKNAQLKVENYIGNFSGDETQEVDETDFDKIRDIMISFRKNTEQEAQAQIDKLVSIPERVTSWKIVREDDKIVGHDHLVEDIMDSERARMNAIYATNDNVRDRIMNSHVNAAVKNGIKLIDNFFFGPTEEMEGPYLNYGFEVSDLWSYRKDL